MAIGTVLAVLFIPAILFVLVNFFGLKFQFDKTSGTITKFLTLVKVLPPVNAECYLDVDDWQIIEIVFKFVLFCIFLYVCYKLVRFAMPFVNMNNIAEIQNKYKFPTTFLLDKTELYLQFINSESVKLTGKCKIMFPNLYLQLSHVFQFL